RGGRGLEPGQIGELARGGRDRIVDARLVGAGHGQRGAGRVLRLVRLEGGERRVDEVVGRAGLRDDALRRVGERLATFARGAAKASRGDGAAQAAGGERRAGAARRSGRRRRSWRARRRGTGRARYACLTPLPERLGERQLLINRRIRQHRPRRGERLRPGDDVLHRLLGLEDRRQLRLRQLPRAPPVDRHRQRVARREGGRGRGGHRVERDRPSRDRVDLASVELRRERVGGDEAALLGGELRGRDGPAEARRRSGALEPAADDVARFGIGEAGLLQSGDFALDVAGGFAPRRFDRRFLRRAEDRSAARRRLLPDDRLDAGAHIWLQRNRGGRRRAQLGRDVGRLRGGEGRGRRRRDV